MTLSAHVAMVVESKLFQIAVKRQGLASKLSTHERFGAALSGPLPDFGFPFQNISSHTGTGSLVRKLQKLTLFFNP